MTAPPHLYSAVHGSLKAYSGLWSNSISSNQLQSFQKSLCAETQHVRDLCEEGREGYMKKKKKASKITSMRNPKKGEKDIFGSTSRGS